MGKWECWLNINLYNLTVVFRFVINFPANGNKWKNIFYPPPSDACMSLSWRLDECCQIYLNISQSYVYDTKQWNDEKNILSPNGKLFKTTSTTYNDDINLQHNFRLCNIPVIVSHSLLFTLINLSSFYILPIDIESKRIAQRRGRRRWIK